MANWTCPTSCTFLVGAIAIGYILNYKQLTLVNSQYGTKFYAMVTDSNASSPKHMKGLIG